MSEFTESMSFVLAPVRFLLIAAFISILAFRAAQWLLDRRGDND